ncbi:MAG: LuxR C-terminal-related transcriptional regulator [Treponema sp.]|jgi:LuxR family maltose regulon positive regulatory protein|nr:LuxR C-terminal-related transcriptional regulator [Treponema sp.]
MRQKISSFAKDQPFLERPQVNSLLQGAIQNPLLIVTAGPGYGKTQAVSSFLRDYDAAIIWMQLSPEDNLGWRFWEHYTGLVTQMRGGLGAQLAELGFPETLRQFDRYMTLFYGETRSRKKYITVFDDFHLIRDTTILHFFERILAAPPPDTAMILISRTEPALNTVHLLSRGILARLTMEDLRFSREEITRFFRMQSIPLSGEEAAQIHRDTDGWALAVNLIARSLKTRKTGADGYSSFLKDSFRKIEDTLFTALEDDQQKSLIKLSLLDYWPQELLKELPKDQGRITEMDSSLYSFIRYDAYLQGYRIHHLFLELLREKQNLLSSGEIREVYIRAAGWYLRNNLKLDAAVNYERAGDYRGFLSVIEAFPRIPPQRVTAFLLEIADRMIAAPPPPPEGAEQEDFLFLRYIIRAKLLMCLGRFDESAGEAREIIKQFEPLPPSPRRSRLLAAAYNNLGTLVLFTARYTKNHNAAPYFERGYHYYREYPDPIRGQISQSNLGSYIIQVGVPAEPGEIERALDMLASAIPYASASLDGHLSGADSLARAELAYYQTDLTRAEQFAREAVYQGREKKQYEVENRGLFYLMRICTHTGHIPEIRELQWQLEAQLEITEYLNRYTIYDIGMGRFYAQIGLTGKIAPWLRNEYEEGELNALFHNFDIMVKLRCHFSEKQYDLVLRALEHKENWRELESFLLGKLEITILEAAARYHLGEEEQALAVLEKAYLMAASNSLDMPFIELGEDMRLLVEAALLREGPRYGQIPRPWLENIRSRASAYSKKLLIVVEQYLGENQIGKQPLVYLTCREREVLSGLAKGLTREDISAETGLSLNTVKAVIRLVYGKLGAKNRADAIRIAINLGFVKTL